MAKDSWGKECENGVLSVSSNQWNNCFGGYLVQVCIEDCPDGYLNIHGHINISCANYICGQSKQAQATNIQKRYGQKPPDGKNSYLSYQNANLWFSSASNTSSFTGCVYGSSCGGAIQEPLVETVSKAKKLYKFGPPGLVNAVAKAKAKSNLSLVNWNKFK